MAETVSVEHHFDERLQSLRGELDGRITRAEEKAAEAGATQWPTIIALAVFLTMIVGGFGYYINAEFAAAEKTDGEVKASIERVRADLFGEVRRIDAELLQRRQEFVQQGEFRQFEKTTAEREARREAIDATVMPRAAFDAWASERNRLIEIIMSRLHDLEAKR